LTKASGYGGARDPDPKKDIGMKILTIFHYRKLPRLSLARSSWKQRKCFCSEAVPQCNRCHRPVVAALYNNSFNVNCPSYETQTAPLASACPHAAGFELLHTSDDEHHVSSPRQNQPRTLGASATWSRGDLDFFLHGSMSTEFVPVNVLRPLSGLILICFPSQT